MNSFELLESLTQEKKNIEKQILNVQAEIYTMFGEELSTKQKGTFNFVKDGFKIKITKKVTTSVDQEMADAIGIGFKKKYSLDAKAYGALTDEQKATVDECLTTKPAKPSFAVERVDSE